MRRRYWVPAGMLVLFSATAFWGCQRQKTPVPAASVSPTAVPAVSPPYGIATRVAWTSGRVSGSPEAPPAYVTQRAYPKLTFDSPLDIAFAPSIKRVFVVQQHAKIFTFADRDDVDRADLLLDLNQVRDLDQVPQCKGAGDTYGIALHPRFASNHYCYVCYTLDYYTHTRNHENGSRVSRFTVSDTDPPVIDPASEVILLQWLGGGHNGGCLKFGPDGYLYITTGDGGDPNPPDPFKTGQDISDLLSSVLRIDVDHPDAGRQYSIPKDNPFVKTPGARPEVWCYGLRNPWRMNFDSQTGNLWIGDVGWELWESVICAKAGGNYGWSIMEGPNPVYPQGKRGPTPLVPPLAALPHTEADSITGGVVYRGRELPELTGQYIFGDWQTLCLWAAKCVGEKQDKLEPYRLIARTDQKIVAFGETPDGEPVIVDHGGGGLWKLSRNPDAGKPSRFPRKLSETGIFTSTKDQMPAPGVIPFSINAPQWVDGATAERWIAVPGGQNVTWGKGVWGDDKPAWPKDSVLVRTLSLPRLESRPGPTPSTKISDSIREDSGTPIKRNKRVETQLLHFDGKQWQGYSYAWNDEQTEAELVDGGGDVKMIGVPEPAGVRKQRWQFPSRAQCMTCHNSWCDYTLAFDLRQLDRRQAFEGGIVDNEIRTFRHIGLLVEPLPPKPGSQASSPKEPDDKLTLTDPYDRSADLYERARSYLHVNCSHCHRFGAGGSALFDVRKEVRLDKTHAVNIAPNLGNFGIVDGKIVCSGDPARSVMLYRMAKLGRERMPHIGSDVVDERGVELIREWVEALAAEVPPPDPAPAVETARQEYAMALRQLEDPATAAADAQAAADHLLATTGGALALICDLQAGRVSGQARELATQSGIKSPSDLVRDLFRRFDPDEGQSDRLGPNFNSSRLLAMAGDAERGRKIFFEAAGTGLCAKCHRAGGAGADFGPDLSHIATKYNAADLLDNIVNPSRTIAPGYALYVLRTNSGDVLTGLLVRQTDQESVLKDATLKETRVPASEIQKLTAQTTSAMPEGLLNDLTAQEASDLMAFLRTQK